MSVVVVVVVSVMIVASWWLDWKSQDLPDLVFHVNDHKTDGSLFHVFVVMHMFDGKVLVFNQVYRFWNLCGQFVINRFCNVNTVLFSRQQMRNISVDILVETTKIPRCIDDVVYDGISFSFLRT